MHCRFITHIDAIDATRWNTITGVDYPFLRHEFLAALEASGSVSSTRGWQPQHVLVEDAGQLIAVLPLYLKTHSWGEYVFDHAWADAYSRHGVAYYPKLVSAIPFTPASGSRLAFKHAEPATIVNLVNAALQDKAHALGASGWHCLFPATEEVEHWRACNDIALRLGCQYHWLNRNYQHFDDFLAEMNAKKRYSLKKERERVSAAGIRLERLSGSQITGEHWQRFYRFYQSTYLKHSGHGGYLTPAFFDAVHDTLRDQMMLVLAYEGDKAIAGSLNFFSSDTLYGRYWGASKDVDCLHFEACYYQGIEFCIERGLQRFDPGAQGEHKIPRGFRPTLTYSCHWIKHPGFRAAIHDFLREEAMEVTRYQAEAAKALPFK